MLKWRNVFKIKANRTIAAIWAKIFSRVELRLKNPKRGKLITQNTL